VTEPVATAPPAAAAELDAAPATRRFDPDRLRSLGILFPFIALFIALTVTSSAFATSTNLLDILDQQSSTLVVAAAGTLVLVAGGIDLSVGATYSLAAVTAGHFAAESTAGVAVFAGIGVGALVGLVNGLIVTRLKINALITTLAMFFVVGGVASLVTNGNLITLFNKQAFGNIAQSSFLGVRTSIWIMLVPVIGVGLLLARTTIGRYIYAVGGNADAARLAGIRVDSVRVLTFVLSGTMAGLAGVIDTSRVLSAAASTQDTNTLAFTVIGGIVVGGTSILGGDGAVWRTVIGILFIALIGNGYILLGLDPLYQQITLGVLMIGAVSLDVWSRRQRG
jgi:ribose transport system permease protein